MISNFCADQARLKSFSQYKKTSSAIEYCPLFEALLKCKAVLQFLQFVTRNNFKWVLNYLKMISSNLYIYIYSEQRQACSMRSMNSKADFTKYEREVESLSSDTADIVRGEDITEKFGLATLYGPQKLW